SGMHRQLRELLDRAGLQHHSPQVVRDTYIVRLWHRGLTRQQIAQLTGIRKGETITRKIRHLLPEPEEVFSAFLPWAVIQCAWSNNSAEMRHEILRPPRCPQTRFMDTPPSTSIAEPVVKLEASEARYKADRAISSGVAMRLRAC